MAKKDTAVAAPEIASNPIVPTGNAALTDAAPSYLQGVEADQNTIESRQFTIVPRLKTMQRGAKNVDLLNRYGEGAVVVIPSEALVLEPQKDRNGKPDVDTTEPVLFNPIYFYPEWMTWKKHQGVKDP